tara:strand:+ start:510 stop:1436 length:927 start_codon:yes stop_codon:yes gene_type:complete
MKILINRRPVDGPWGGGNLLVKAFCSQMIKKGHTIIHKLEDDIDAIMLQDPRPESEGISINEAVQYRVENPKTKIIQRINECDARKNTKNVDDMLLECSKYIDATIFVSEWIKNYHLKNGWLCNNNHVIYNGINFDHFKKRKKKNNGKINIVTHHWSNNVLKGFDVYDMLDEFVNKNKEFSFSYIGRCRGTFKNTNVIKPLIGKNLGLELSKYDVYVSASRFDPGPNHILESLACEIPTYVFKDGGGCVEFAGSDHSYDSFDKLEEILKNRNFKNNNFVLCDWVSCINNFENLILREVYIEDDRKQRH